MIIPPWHPTRPTDRAVYHDDTGCPEGAAIELHYRRPGTGGRPRCGCGTVVGTIVVGGSTVQGTAIPLEAELPETRERHCPICRSG